MYSCTLTCTCTYMYMYNCGHSHCSSVTPAVILSISPVDCEVEYCKANPLMAEYLAGVCENEEQVWSPDEIGL